MLKNILKNTVKNTTQTHAFDSTTVNVLLLLARLHIGLSIAIGAGISKVNEFPAAAWFVSDLKEFGFPFPEVMAFMASWGEVIGGFLLAAGLLTRLGGALVCIVLGVAAFIYHGVFPIVDLHIAHSLFFLSLTFLAIGGGKYSLDYWMSHSKESDTSKAKLATVVMAGLLIPVFSNTAFGQVKGNGDIETRTMEVKVFDRIHVDFPADVVVRFGEEFKVEMTVDENIFSSIGVNTRNRKLSITQDKWIQPSDNTKIQIVLPELFEVKTGGYGTTRVEDLMAEELIVDNPVGEFYVSGMLENFFYTSKQGKLDARDLEANTLDVSIDGRGKAFVNPTEVFNAEATNNGRIIYTKMTDDFATKERLGGKILSEEENRNYEEELGKAVYVSIGIHNNSRSRIQTKVVGPENAPFSYGMPIGARVTKAERWPVGTQLFQTRRFGKERLIYTVKKSDEGKKVDLF